jgi:hypothetical protein
MQYNLMEYAMLLQLVEWFLDADDYVSFAFCSFGMDDGIGTYYDAFLLVITL